MTTEVTERRYGASEENVKAAMVEAKPYISLWDDQGLDAGIRETWRVFRLDGAVELAAFECGSVDLRDDGKRTFWQIHGQGIRYVKSVDEAIAAAKDILGQRGFYCVPAPLKPGVETRYDAGKWSVALKNGTAKESDVTASHVLIVDADPARPPNTSSTKLEMMVAMGVAQYARQKLRDAGVPENAIAFARSGNGAHTLILLDVDWSDEVKDLRCRILKALAVLCDYTGQKVKVTIDQSMTDGSRYAPLYGTLKRKGGRGHADNPWRTTALVGPEDLEPLDLDGLRKLASALESMTTKEAVKAWEDARGTRGANVAPTLKRSADNSEGKMARKQFFEDVQRLPMDNVMGVLGLSTDECPGCGAQRGKGSDLLTKDGGPDVWSCFHNTCVSSNRSYGKLSTKGAPCWIWSNLDLIAMAHNIGRAEKGFTEKMYEVGESLGLRRPAKGPVKVDPYIPVPDRDLDISCDEIDIEAFLSGDEVAVPDEVPSGDDTYNVAWQEDIVRLNNGQGRPLARNVDLCLRNDPDLQGLVRWNELAQCVELDREPPWKDQYKKGSSQDDPWNDQDDSKLGYWLHDRYKIIGLADATVFASVMVVAKEHSYHPVRAYLSNLAWDGTPRVDSWLTRYCGVEDTEYARLVGRWWLIGAVARGMRPGCQVDSMLVFEGKQQAGKTTTLRILGGDYFSEADLGDLSKNDAITNLHGAWIHEFGEGTILRRADSKALKDFLTKRYDQYTPKWVRTRVSTPRSVVFAMTQNDSAGYLVDKTGNRRFWPVACGEFDVKSLERDRDNLFAEAVHMWKSGEKWHPETERERELCAREAADRTEESPWQEKVGVILAGIKDEDSVTIGDVLTGLGLSIGQMTSIARRQAGEAMRAAGWEQTKSRKQGARRWVRGPEADPYDPEAGNLRLVEEDFPDLGLA